MFKKLKLSAPWEISKLEFNTIPLNLKNYPTVKFVGTWWNKPTFENYLLMIVGLLFAKLLIEALIIFEDIGKFEEGDTKVYVLI